MTGRLFLFALVLVPELVVVGVGYAIAGWTGATIAACLALAGNAAAGATSFDPTEGA